MFTLYKHLLHFNSMHFRFADTKLCVLNVLLIADSDDSDDTLTILNEFWETVLILLIEYYFCLQIVL